MRNLVDKCIMRKIRQMHYNIEFGRYFDHEKMPPKNHKNPHTPIPKSKFHVCFTTVGYFIVTLAIFRFFLNAWKIQPPKTGSTYPQEIWSMCLSTPAKKSFNHFGLDLIILIMFRVSLKVLEIPLPKLFLLGTMKFGRLFYLE